MSAPLRRNPGRTKPVSEPVRERETFKYEPFLHVNTRFNETGKQLPSSEIFSSNDGVLTALAQVAITQTNTDRALISLFDADYQYYIAEATALLPLTPRLPNHLAPETLWACGTAVPRSHAVCEFVLYSEDDDELTCQEGREEIPITIVSDLRKDSRFADKPYAALGGGSSAFYASVPIRTSRGINIGAICVLKPQPPETWNDECARRLKEVSYTIMDHLESKRSRHAHRRGQRLNRGLGSFIEGRSTISGWHYDPNLAAFLEDSRSEANWDVDRRQFRQHKGNSETKRVKQIGQEESLQELLNDRQPKRLTKSPDLLAIVGGPEMPANIQDLHRDEEDGLAFKSPRLIFSKAANIIREAFETEGCIFVDVTLGAYKSSSTYGKSEDSDGERSPVSTPSTSSCDEKTSAPRVDESDIPCEHLGFSTPRLSSINGDKLAPGEKTIPKRFLARLLRRYPLGKIFNFDAGGELQYSDSPAPDATAGAGRLLSLPEGSVEIEGAGEPAVRKQKQREKRAGRPYEAGMIRAAFPDARSVAFLPVWDVKKERWLAGGFVYTSAPTRTFTVEGELSFLKVFALMAAADILSLEASQAEKAKSDALGSLSHEIRSPLHGVILGTELLNDTDLSVFQENATHTIETCCRTLLDTIDHLLDYSKVNSFEARRKTQEVSLMSYPTKNKRMSSFLNLQESQLNTRLDTLTEEVVESIFAGFNFQHMSIKQLAQQQRKKSHGDITAHNILDSTQAMEQLGPTFVTTGDQSLHFENVSVFISINPSHYWSFHVQAGAIRRILMNLFGNSLKYTARGSIWVTLTQDSASLKRHKNRRLVRLTVQDTGKGIGEAFLRHDLFKPFCQEDELAPGTGLGLSIVKKITSQLGGRISVHSEVGVGTTIIVTLPLEPSPLPSPLSETDRTYEGEFDEQLKELRGLRVCLKGFEDQQPLEDGEEDDGECGTIQSICRRWLHMEVLVMQDDSERRVPDIMLWSADYMKDSSWQKKHRTKTPTVVVCQDALMAYQQLALHETAKHDTIFEFISQPIGPRKLAKSISLAYKRWTGLPKGSVPTRPVGPQRSRSSYAGPNSSSSILVSEAVLAAAAAAASESTAQITPEADQVEEPVVETCSKEPERPHEVPKPKSPLHIPQRKILLVDDNHINLKILSSYMSKLGHPYDLAVNGLEALEAYTKSPGNYIGILMDMSMPVMDGFQATRSIRAFEIKNEVTPVAIFALTGLASDNAHRNALESGVDLFLTKPVKLKALKSLLESKNIVPHPTEA